MAGGIIRSLITAAWLAVPGARAIAADVPGGPVVITSAGAACDGTTDDSAAFARLMTPSTREAWFIIPPGKMCLIRSADLVVPPHVRIEGSGAPVNIGGSLPMLSGLLLEPGRTILMGAGASLQHLLVRRAAMAPDPTADQVIQAVAQWCSDRAAAVTIPKDTGGVRLSDLFIEGFGTAIRSYSGQYSISHVAADSCNGMEQDGGGDNSYVDDVRFEPYYAMKLPPKSGAWNRPGIAFYFHDGGTGWYCTRCFSFMWQNGLVLSNEGVGTVANSGFEWQSSSANGATGTVGIRWIGHNAETSARNVYLNGFSTSASDEGIGEVIMSGLSSLPDVSSGVTGFYLAGTSAETAMITIGGRMAAGSTIRISFAGPAAASIAYTTIEHDTPAQIASALQDQIAHHQALIGSRIAASVSGAKLRISWPPAVDTKIAVAAEGGVAAELGKAPALPGSYGMISDTDAGGGNYKIPVFTFAPNTGRWNINGLFEANGALPRDWAAIGSPNDQITFSAIPWSHLNERNLTDCGAGAKTDGHSTDHAGRVTEGEDAAGCVIRFTTPYPVAPQCIVSSPNGAAITYKSGPAEIRVANNRASQTELTYRCDL